MSEQPNRRNVAGFVLIIIGLAFLVRNLDFVWLPSYLFTWKTLLITIGVVALALGKRDGFIPLIIGIVFFLAQDIFNIYIRIRDWWPLILILLGVFILLRHQRRGRERNDLGSPYIDEVAIFSGMEKKVTSENFKGGKTTAICGGADIDLRDAILSSGNNVIDMFAMFGGTTFTIPSDWTVNLSQLTVLFGGFSDERVNRPQQDANPDKVLYIKGFILFGGGELKNA